MTTQIRNTAGSKIANAFADDLGLVIVKSKNTNGKGFVFFFMHDMRQVGLAHSDGEACAWMRGYMAGLQNLTHNTAKDIES